MRFVAIQLLGTDSIMVVATLGTEGFASLNHGIIGLRRSAGWYISGTLQGFRSRFGRGLSKCCSYCVPEIGFLDQVRLGTHWLRQLPVAATCSTLFEVKFEL